MELMTDLFATQNIKLLKNSDGWKKLVTLYHGKGKKINMEYSSFLKLLPALSELFGPQEDQEDSLKVLLKHLMIVYDQKVAEEI